jgi:hypothetical protein
MKVWWESRCHSNHRWETYDDEAPEPPATAATCPIDGSAAVTISPQPPADRVAVTISPAARIVDSVTKAIRHEGEYFIEIWSFDHAETRRNTKALSWEDAVNTVELFRGVSWADALVRWKRAGLDRD